jgi:hypothetical protein
MNRIDFISEKRNAKYRMSFFKIHRLCSYRAYKTYHFWLKEYNDLKEATKIYNELKKLSNNQ